ncbi:RNA polymerase sigma factor [Chitinophaga rhizophila]|uniref:RNA polymerase sigma factor n=1 Tax=Chitinophaga rhizophila TaxID=2866212 RepID=A0ABS7G5Q6_9BACT|nr:sigma-70 family RNA polymerase sigma factor [Chitinophaga rhizophila]MBW8682969.1 RNA polymerase sigma factor [Chitinophaga rhizophila]
MTQRDHPLFQRVLPDNEIHLVRAAAGGDRDAYGQLYTHYYPGLQVAITFITQDKDETDELLQETFLRIWKTREKLLLIRSFENYAFRIARNLLFDQLRRKKVHLKAIDTIAQRAAMEVTGGEGPLVYKELHTLAIRAINELEPKKRDIFLLRTEEGLSFEEIAARYDMAVVTVKKHYYAAFHTLKSVLEQHGGMISILFLLWLRGK